MLAVLHWIRARLLSALFASIGLYAAYLAMRQSYHFGHGLGVSEIGKESYAQWLTLTDVATTLLPIAAVMMWRRGSKITGVALGVATLIFTSFSISNQIGFGAAERLGQSAKVAAVNKAYADAKADQKKLREGTIDWLKGTATNRGVLKSSRMEAIASTERLIAQAGAIDPDKVYGAPTDIQAQSLATLTNRWTSWNVSVETVALMLVTAIAVLGVAIKPIFLGLSGALYPMKQKEVAHAYTEEAEEAEPEKEALDAHTHAGIRLEPSAQEAPKEEPRVEHAAATHVPETSVPASSTVDPAGGAGTDDDDPPEAPRGNGRSIREYLISDKRRNGAARELPFKLRDKRPQARMADGHVERFLRTLKVQEGELVPFRASVWEKYQRWCADQDLHHMNEKQLSNALSRFGIVKYRPRGGSVYLHMPDDLESRIVSSRKFFEAPDDLALATAH